MSHPFIFPTPPKGYYFQIKSGLESDYPSKPWRVVLVRRRWFFPTEVAGAELEHLTQDDVTSAALQAQMNLIHENTAKLQDKLRKQANREARKK